MMRQPYRARFAALCAAFSAAFCIANSLSACDSHRNDSLEGPSTETVGLTGSVVDSAGKPQAAARIIARPVDYVQDTLESASLHRPGGETDAGAGGRFSLRLPAGEYLVEARSPGVTSMVRCTVSAAGGSLPPLVLRAPAAVRGLVRQPRAPAAAVYAQVYGLDRLLLLQAGSPFVLPGLPAGTHRLRIFSPDPALGSADLPPVSVAAGDTADVGAPTLDSFAAENYALWPSSRAITLHAGIAGLTNDLMGFPLLLRLGPADFPFDSAAADGSDLRFSRAGKHLDFEIENWDPVSRQATLWVKLDTLRARDDGQAIFMHWGKGRGIDPSAGGAVFDTAQGFAEVWHMGSPQGGVLANAAPGGTNLKVRSPAAASAAGGPTPRATGCDGKATFMYGTDSLTGPQTFSLSAWVRADGEGKILGFENYPVPNPMLYDRHIWVTSDGAFHFGIFTRDPPENAVAYRRTISSRTGFLDGVWHLIVATQSPLAGQALYVDGNLEAADAGVVHASGYSGRWVLGDGTLSSWPFEPATTAFRGDLDEVRVENTLRGADWIRMQYESQKPGSTLIAFPGR